MLKKVASLLFLLTLCLSAEDKSYVFEAKGKFAEDLKALVEQYSKDGKVDITVREKTEESSKRHKSTTQTILSAFMNDDAEALKYADVNQGKTLYQNDCAQCHGKNADENSYTVPHKLVELEPLKIIELLDGYRENYTGQFGGSLRLLMKPHADNLTSEEMQSIAAYIYSIKNGKDMATSPLSSSNNQEENSNEVKSSYLQ